jgi:hypothetical protein
MLDLQQDTYVNNTQEFTMLAIKNNSSPDDNKNEPINEDEMDLKSLGTQPDDNEQTLKKQTVKEYCFVMKHLPWNFNQPTQIPQLNCVTINTAYLARKLRRDIWIGDTGASSHFTNDDTGMFDWTTIHDHIGVGDGNAAVATKQGKLRLQVIQKNGNRCTIVLHNCLYIPDLPTNLFSITTALGKNWQLSNKGIYLQLTKDNQQIVFDTIDPTSQGLLMTVRMVPIPCSKLHHAYDMHQYKSKPILQTMRSHYQNVKNNNNRSTKPAWGNKLKNFPTLPTVREIAQPDTLMAVTPPVQVPVRK